jgi:hypothetical protein
MRAVNPMGLLNAMYKVFDEHGVYGGMVELKKRCVRIVYKDEFYLDILPACRDHGNGGTCIQVPDRDLRKLDAEQSDCLCNLVRERYAPYTRSKTFQPRACHG